MKESNKCGCEYCEMLKFYKSLITFSHFLSYEIIFMLGPDVVS